MKNSLFFSFVILMMSSMFYTMSSDKLCLANHDEFNKNYPLYVAAYKKWFKGDLHEARDLYTTIMHSALPENNILKIIATQMVEKINWNACEPPFQQVRHSDADSN